MEQINLSELFSKHNAHDFKIQQVCQFVTKDNTLYEFLYDDASKKAVLDVVTNVGSPDRVRNTFQFDNKDITMYEALDLYGLKNVHIELENVFDSEPAIWSAPVYLGTPVNGLPLANGSISFDISKC